MNQNVNAFQRTADIFAKCSRSQEVLRIWKRKGDRCDSSPAFAHGNLSPHKKNKVMENTSVNPHPGYKQLCGMCS